MADHAAASKGALLSDKTYDAIRWTAQYFLPALGTLYFTLAAIWGLPNAEQVLGTVTALVIFLGVVMGISKKSFDNDDRRFDGEVTVHAPDADNPITDLILDQTPESLQGRTQLVLKVNSGDSH